MNQFRVSMLNLGTIAIFSLFIISETIYAQIEDGAVPRGDVVNSKYLSISDYRYRSGEFSDQITGTIVNNSTQAISSPAVYAALYDENNQLITIENGYADVSPLPPADNSAFSVSLYIPEEEAVDHYTLFAAGRP